MGGRDIEICWWCGKRPANSCEHRIKRTRLGDDLALSQEEGNLLLASYDPRFPRPTELKSTDAKAAKFGRTMCRTCNSERSQSFDYAYRFFAEWAFTHREDIRQGGGINWIQIFKGQEFDHRHLARYYVKNICCRIIDQGYTVPQELIGYLDNLDAEPCFHLLVFSDFALHDVLHEYGIRNYFSPSTMEGHLPHPSDEPIPAEFHTVFLEGYIGTILSWYANEWKPEEMLSLGNEEISYIYDRKKFKRIQPLFAPVDLYEEEFRRKVRNGERYTQPAS